MRYTSKLAVFTLIGFAIWFTKSIADEPKKPEAKPDNKLVGTWKLISAKYNGKDVKLPEGDTRLKYVTPTHFVWTILDKDGVASTTMGGTCTVTTNKYEEVPEFGTSDIIKSFKGKQISFEWKVDGNKWYHTGKLLGDFEIEEVWERVERK